MDSLQGRLLVSAGGLFDPNFRHTVVLVGAHDGAGALGVVLNRPLDVTVEQAVPPLTGLVDRGLRLYRGGPVEPHQPVLLADLVPPSLADVPVFGSVGFLTGEVPATVRAHVRRARVFVGHAGWAAGQLESEMESGSWIVADATVDDVFTPDPGTLWQRVLKRKGPEFAAIARIPFDPSMN